VYDKIYPRKGMYLKWDTINPLLGEILKPKVVLAQDSNVAAFELPVQCSRASLIKRPQI